MVGNQGEGIFISANVMVYCGPCCDNAYYSLMTIKIVYEYLKCCGGGSMGGAGQGPQ